MAKKKAKPSASEEAQGTSRDSIRVRVTPAYKAWLLRFADAKRSDMSDLIDDALVSYAKAEGFEIPPKR